MSLIYLKNRISLFISCIDSPFKKSSLFSVSFDIYKFWGNLIALKFIFTVHVHKI